MACLEEISNVPAGPEENVDVTVELEQRADVTVELEEMADMPVASEDQAEVRGAPLSLDDYCIDTDVHLGTGSTAKIVFARRRESDNDQSPNTLPSEIVLKVMKDDAKLAAEVSILAAVQGHPNMVKCYGVCLVEQAIKGIESSSPLKAIQMECCNGGSLLRGIDNPRLSEYAAHLVMTDVFCGLAHMHELGFVHRDIKPENILLAGDAGVKIADFGISARLDDEAAMSARCGTPGFAAPEILLKKPYGVKVDSFSAGALLYYIISGRLPFNGSSLKSTLLKTIRHAIDFRKSVRLECLSDPCKEFMTQLLEKDPQKRMTAREALDLMLWTEGHADDLEDAEQSEFVSAKTRESAAITEYRTSELAMDVAFDETPRDTPSSPRPINILEDDSNEFGMLCEHQVLRPEIPAPAKRSPSFRRFIPTQTRAKATELADPAVLGRSFARSGMLKERTQEAFRSNQSGRSTYASTSGSTGRSTAASSVADSDTDTPLMENSEFEVVLCEYQARPPRDKLSPVESCVEA